MKTVESELPLVPHIEIEINEKEEIQKTILACQMNTVDKLRFVMKAAKYGGTSHVLRELVKGFTQGRVSIKPPKEKNSLYSEAE